MANYRDFIIKTYENKGEPSNKRIRAHPLPSQGVSTKLNIECSAGMRESHNVGTLFKVNLKVIDRKGTIFLYRHYNWSYEVISPAEADDYIRNEFANSND